MEKVEIKMKVVMRRALLTITSVCGQKAFYSTCRTKGLICIHLM